MGENTGGGYTLTGEAIPLYALLSLRSGLMMEMKHKGLKWSRHGSALSFAKKRLGVGRYAKADDVLLGLDKLIAEQQAKVQPGDVRVHGESA